MYKLEQMFKVRKVSFIIILILGIPWKAPWPFSMFSQIIRWYRVLMVWHLHHIYVHLLQYYIYIKVTYRGGGEENHCCRIYNHIL